MAVHKKFPALGRGLDALISTQEVHTDGSSTINEIELDKIVPNPNQPRREFDPDSLRELADSISEIGIVQPITLRNKGDRKDIPELENCFDALYGVMMLRLQQKPINEETARAVADISKMLGMLSEYYKQEKAGTLKLD